MRVLCDLIAFSTCARLNYVPSLILSSRSYCMRYRKKRKSAILATTTFRNMALLVYLTHMLSSGISQTVIPMEVNSSKHGNTSETLIPIFSKFTKIDITAEEIGLGGQSLFRIDIRDGLLDLEVSTCIGSDFDTYLALFDRNPINNTGALILSESGNDVLCLSGKKKAFLSIRVRSGAYYILVTGNGSENGVFNLTVTGTKPSPTPTPWGLDRVDQRSLPLNQKFAVQDSGAGVWIYLVDSGVRVSHDEFEGRVSEGYDFVNVQQDSAVDCSGHGTHIAGTIAGKNFGVAKKAKIIAVRAFDCSNTAKSSILVDSIGWILADARARSRENVIVALMFSTSSSESSILDSTLRGLIKSGIPVIVPAGNDGLDACDFYPGSVDDFMAVGATDVGDVRSSFSNSGNCTSIYAPGNLVTSSWHTSDNASRVISGTAQAAAHMVGIVGILLDLNDGIKADIVSNVVESISTKDVVRNVPENVTTRFAFVRSIPRFSGDPPSSGNVFLFTILTVGISPCDENTGELLIMRRRFGELLSLQESKIRVTCAIPGTRDGASVEVRIEVPERMAASIFAILESALESEKEKTAESLGFAFSVTEKPWAVDSTRVVFWGAPSFSGAESFSLSSGAIAGAAVGGVCIFAIVVAAAWIVYRKVSKIDEIQSMEGSADFEKGPVHFDDFGATNENSLVPRSFRNVVRAMSFRRNNSMKNGSATGGGGSEKGINKMGSFIGGPGAAVAKDLVSMQSFGGEAFAGMASMSKSNSFASLDTASNNVRGGSITGSDNVLSFRGRDNLVLNKTSTREHVMGPDSSDDPISDDDSMRMQSLGGEAFAMIGEKLRNQELYNDAPNMQSQGKERPAGNDVDSKSDDPGATAPESYGPKQ